MKIGNFEIIVLKESPMRLDGGAMFGVVPKTIWSKWCAPDDLNRIEIAVKSFLIITGDKKIIIDTGNGNKFTEKQKNIYGIDGNKILLTSLEEKNIPPEEIDIVINTHLHFDHCGGNTTYNAQGKIIPTFPRATYIVQRGEYDYATLKAYKDKASYLKENYEPLKETGQLKLIDGDTSIVEGLRIKVTGGHTKFHQIVLLESQGQKAIFWADIMCMTSLIKPKYTTSYDLYPLETVNIKKKLLEKAIEENYISIFNHDPKIDFAKIIFDGKDYQYVQIRD